MIELTASDETCLRWARRCNEDGIGFLGPTVRKLGRIGEYESAVSKGLVRCVEPAFLRSHTPPMNELGYWLTEHGRNVLAALSDQPPSGG